MPNKEKVVQGLKACSACLGSCPTECPYYDHTRSCTGIQLKKEALALLESRKPVVTTNAYGKDFFRCANCGYDFEMYVGNPRRIKYCPICGQGVKWDD